MDVWEPLRVRVLQMPDETNRTRLFELIDQNKPREVKNWLVVLRLYAWLDLVPSTDGNQPPGGEIYLG